MIYLYLIILLLFLLLFICSCKENVSGYTTRMINKPYPGEVFFLKAAVWCMRVKEKCTGGFDMNGKPNSSVRYKEQISQSRLGGKLKLLNQTSQVISHICLRIGHRNFYPVRQKAMVVFCKIGTKTR